MATIKIGITSVIFPISEANAAPIYVDAIDYRESGGIVDVPDEAVIALIKANNPLFIDRKSWENFFKVKSFSISGFNDEYAYFLETSKPNKKPGVVEATPGGKKTSLQSIRDRLKKKEVSPGDVVDVTIAEAKDIIKDKFDAGEIDFIREVRSLLSTYKDEELEEHVNFYLDQLERLSDGVEFTKDKLMEQGSRYINKLASTMNIKNIQNYKEKEALIDAILAKHKASTKGRRELSKKM